MRRALPVVLVGWSLVGWSMLATACGGARTDAPAALKAGSEVAPGSTPSMVPNVPAAVSPPSWLYVVRAPSGTLRRSATDAPLQLVLEHVDPGVLAFTDRPARKVRHDTIRALVENWQTGFGEDAPNAALVLDDQTDPAGDAMAVVLGQPQLSGEGRLSVPVTPVDGGEDRRWAALVSHTIDASVPEEFHEVSLFIDADLGSRSLEVLIVNNTHANLTVMSVTGAAGSTWVAGEQPHVSQLLPLYQSAWWGTRTDDPNGDTGMTLQLGGFGSTSVSIDLVSHGDDTVHSSVVGNDKIAASVVDVDSGNPAHRQMQVTLTSPTPSFPR